jgi:YgiT-type zinc finger domain-containing protein
MTMRNTGIEREKIGVATNSEERRTCTECRGKAIGRRENHTYTECGLKNVVLVDVLVYRCERCGAEQIQIPNMDGLHRTVALAAICKRHLLSGDEIRFLRNVADLTATNLAKSLAVTKHAVSRWENGGKIGAASDRSIRAVCGMKIIADIVDQQSGLVDPKDIEKTVRTLQRFFVQFKTQNVLAAGVQDERGEAEKLMIDPTQPFNFSLLPTVACLPGSATPAIQ